MLMLTALEKGALKSLGTTCITLWLKKKESGNWKEMKLVLSAKMIQAGLEQNSSSAWRQNELQSPTSVTEESVCAIWKHSVCVCVRCQASASALKRVYAYACWDGGMCSCICVCSCIYEQERQHRMTERVCFWVMVSISMAGEAMGE